MKDKQIRELLICALEQDYGKDLRPLFKKPVVDFALYCTILDIYEEECSE